MNHVLTNFSRFQLPIKLRAKFSVCLVTGRNEVLAKVIFSQACVILSTGGVGIPACLAGQSWGGGYPSMPCRSVPGGSGPGGCFSNFLGVSNFSGGLQFFEGVSNLGGLRGG